MIKKNLYLPLTGLQGFVDSVVALIKLNLKSLQNSFISKRSKELEVSIPFLLVDTMRHLAIHLTGLRMFGEGEWKVKKYDSDKRRTWHQRRT